VRRAWQNIPSRTERFPRCCYIVSATKCQQSLITYRQGNISRRKRSLISL
jgi:hypothetical protein